MVHKITMLAIAKFSCICERPHSYLYASTNTCSCNSDLNFEGGQSSVLCGCLPEASRVLSPLKDKECTVSV